MVVQHAEYEVVWQLPPDDSQCRHGRAESKTGDGAASPVPPLAWEEDLLADVLYPGAVQDEDVELLLSGSLAWCACPAPRGFGYAALIAAPSLAPSRHLVMVANRDGPLNPTNLGMAAAHLARAGAFPRGTLDLR